MDKIQNLKPVAFWVFEKLNLEFVWDLDIRILDLFKNEVKYLR